MSSKGNNGDRRAAPRTETWLVGVDRVDRFHQAQTFGTLRNRRVVRLAPRQPEQLALATHVDRLVVRLDQTPTHLSRRRTVF